jgi:hypothetical protein
MPHHPQKHAHYFLNNQKQSMSRLTLVTWAWLPQGKVKVSKIDSGLAYIPPIITKNKFI